MQVSLKLLLPLLAVIVGCSNPESTVVQAQQSLAKDKTPNVLLVVVDDMGYSDLGSFGSEINTPALDTFAEQGVRFANFHATPMCATTRAALLTGQDHHFAGVGVGGSDGHLNERVVSIATVLQSAGYHTSMSGKWHLGRTAEQSPKNHGFTRSYALMSPGANHFSGGDFHPTYPSTFTEDGQPAKYPDGVYSSQYFTTRAKEYISEAVSQGKPFFSYLALTAPHAPIQAPAELIEKYKGLYDSGFESLRRERLNRMADMGVLNGAADIPYVSPPQWPEWQTLTDEERKTQARIMEVYAAMVEGIDQSFANMIAHLRRLDQLDNTLIVFMSDNGANGGDPLKSAEFDWPSLNFNNALDNIGSQSSNIFLGKGWAAATTAPFRLFKWYTSEGGIRTAAFVWGPSLFEKSGISTEFVSVTDIYSTILDVSTTRVNAEDYIGAKITSDSATSWMPYLQGDAATIHGEGVYAGWEYNGNRAALLGKWKTLQMPKPFGNGNWQLYDLSTDIGETQDLAEKYPQKLEAVKDVWSNYVEKNNVFGTH